ncbi:hypothetical protein [Microcoleus anatoxicus]|uniref:Uncharacterized protein n=1 Tax=Microcoleus anatoxicus PTRS2 TaxID=2705321 RepID=A0ABU8YKD6_9CYAN
MKNEIRFNSVEEILKLIDEIPLKDREHLLSSAIKSLPVDSRSRVLGMSDSGLTVVTGSFVNLNSEIAINIQNSNSTFDPQAVINALIEWKRSAKV